MVTGSGFGVSRLPQHLRGGQKGTKVILFQYRGVTVWQVSNHYLAQIPAALEVLSSRALLEF